MANPCRVWSGCETTRGKKKPATAWGVSTIDVPKAYLLWAVFYFLYLFVGPPPLSLGAVQLRLICEEDTAVAVSPVGGVGAAARVVPGALLDGEPVPIPLIAETL